jgi:hypothetical protein
MKGRNGLLHRESFYIVTGSGRRGVSDFRAMSPQAPAPFERGGVLYELPGTTGLT